MKIDCEGLAPRRSFHAFRAIVVSGLPALAVWKLLSLKRIRIDEVQREDMSKTLHFVA